MSTPFSMTDDQSFPLANGAAFAGKFTSGMDRVGSSQAALFEAHNVKRNRRAFKGAPGLMSSQLEDVQVRAMVTTATPTRGAARAVSGPPVPWISPGGTLAGRFRDLVAQWRVDTAFESSMTKMVLHPAYQRIIGLGPDVLPLLLRELQQEPDHWFFALNALTGENPVPEEARGSIDSMSDAWLAWGRREGLIGV